MTTSRRALIEALAMGGHSTAELLLVAVRRAQPGVNPSTVYRTLAQLEEIGVVVHVHLAHGPAVYHLAGNEHAHIVCTGCEQVSQVPTDVVSAVREAFSSDGRFDLAWQHFAWMGICAACQSTRALAAELDPAGAK